MCDSWRAKETAPRLSTLKITHNAHIVDTGTHHTPNISHYTHMHSIIWIYVSHRIHTIYTHVTHCSHMQHTSYTCTTFIYQIWRISLNLPLWWLWYCFIYVIFFYAKSRINGHDIHQKLGEFQTLDSCPLSWENGMFQAGCTLACVLEWEKTRQGPPSVCSQAEGSWARVQLSQVDWSWN